MAIFWWQTSVNRRYQNVSILDFTGARDYEIGGDNWGCKIYKDPVKSSPPTNQHPAFCMGWMHFLSPNQQRQSTEGYTRAEYNSLNYNWERQSGVKVSLAPSSSEYNTNFGILRPYLYKVNRPSIRIQWRVVSTNILTLEFEYDFACTRKGVHLRFVMSSGKMIFAVLEL